MVHTRPAKTFSPRISSVIRRPRLRRRLSPTSNATAPRAGSPRRRLVRHPVAPMRDLSVSPDQRCPAASLPHEAGGTLRTTDFAQTPTLRSSPPAYGVGCFFRESGFRALARTLDAVDSLPITSLRRPVLVNCRILRAYTVAAWSPRTALHISIRIKRSAGSRMRGWRMPYPSTTRPGPVVSGRLSGCAWLHQLARRMRGSWYRCRA